jgi:hypothetical protein
MRVLGGRSLVHTASTRDKSNILTPFNAPSDSYLELEIVEEHLNPPPGNRAFECCIGHCVRIVNTPRQLALISKSLRVLRTMCVML